ncbi:MAG: PIG-L family deacetylase [Oscillospiraceae bacterium]|nr:PIG-L family deacetylase [Oscillospiraceae bacterium]
MKKRNVFLIIAVTAVAAAFLIIGISAYNIKPIDDDVLAGIDTQKAKCLMITAHPDDESLWGGAHLAADDYLVVCLTHASDKVRSSEFKNAMQTSDDQYIILDYPDKVYGRRDNWKRVRDKMTADIDKIINLKQWDLVVTHNPEGEYGHQHHKMTSNMVTEVYNKTSRQYPLYYFGTYYRASQKDKIDKLIPERQEQTEIKEKMLEHYTSQSRVVEKFGHMLNYEQWNKEN